MVDYSLIYHIRAKVQSAVDGFKRVQGSFGNVSEKAGIMGRKMEKTLTLQKLGWLGFAYMVGKSVRDIMLKSTILQTFIGTWAKMFGALLDVILAPLIPVFVWLTDNFMKLFKWFQDLSKPAKTVIAVILIVAGAFATLLGWFILVLPFLKALAGVVGFVGLKAAVAGAGSAIAAFLVAIGPVGWAILAIVAAVAILAYAWHKNWGDIQGKTKAVIAWFKSYDWASLFGPILKWLRWLVEKMRESWSIIKKATIESWEKITEILQKTWDTISTIAEKTWKTINLVIATAFLLIRSILIGDTEFFKKVWSKFVERIKEIWRGVWIKAKEIFMAAGKRLIDIVISIKNKIITYFSELPDRIKEFFRDVPQKIADFFTALPQKIIDAIGDIGTFLWNKIKVFLKGLDDKLFAWASGKLGLSPPLKMIGVFLKRTLENSFLQNAINVLPKINDSFLFKNLANIEAKTNKYLKNIRAEIGFDAKIPSGGTVTIDKRSYNISIPVSVTTEMKDEGKSSEEIANDVAVILSEKMRSII